ncbi:hypothetical protein AC249_AIPGENE20279, partial [Exaiptasia diaphana]
RSRTSPTVAAASVIGLSPSNVHSFCPMFESKSSKSLSENREDFKTQDSSEKTSILKLQDSSRKTQAARFKREDFKTARFKREDFKAARLSEKENIVV